MCSQFLFDRILKTEALIVVYEDALTALGSGNVQSYVLDTGQTRQQVNKFDVKTLNDTLDSLLNRLVTLEARCGNRNGGTIIARPAF